MKRNLSPSPGRKRFVVVPTVGSGFALLAVLCLIGGGIVWLKPRSSSIAVPTGDRPETGQALLKEQPEPNLVTPNFYAEGTNSAATMSAGSAATSQVSSEAHTRRHGGGNDPFVRASSGDDADAALFAALERLERQMATAIAKARESVVALEYTATDTPRDTRRVATGVVINLRGDVLSINIDPPPSAEPTAGKGSARIVALDALGHRHAVHWVAADPETGLTLLRVAPRAVRPIRPASSMPNLGSQAFVVGNPFGMGHSVSRGHVAGLDRALDLGDRQLGGLIQVQAPLYPGDSGAAVVNLHGDWLGLIRSGLALPTFEPEPNSNAPQPSGLPPSGAHSSSSLTNVSLRRPERDTSFGFAIPTRDALWVADQLRTRGCVDRAYLGVRLEAPLTAALESPPKLEQRATLTPVTMPSITGNADSHTPTSVDSTPALNEGAVLREVLAGTPASQAGLQPGDRIVELDRQPIRTPYDLTDRLDRIPARTTITLAIVRDRRAQLQHTLISLCTASRPEPPQASAPVSPAASGATDPAKAIATVVTAIAPQPAQPNLPSSARTDYPSTTSVSLGSPAPDDLKLNLPRAVVERLEKLERRLERLESFPSTSPTPTSATRPQIGSARRP
jgi:serine protease Do